MRWNEQSNARFCRCGRLLPAVVVSALIALMGAGWNAVTAQQNSLITPQPPHAQQVWRGREIAGHAGRSRERDDVRKAVQGVARPSASKFSQITSTGDLCVPHWDSAIGQPGMMGIVRSLTVFDDGSGAGPALYAGGDFWQAGGVPVNHIAKWDGSSWSPLGSGTEGIVYSLIVFDDGSGAGPALYAGGDFWKASGVQVNNIAKWDGSSWSPVGTGMDGGVLALTVFDDGTGPALYAGGIFSTAGGGPANMIAKWDGSSWSPLGSGIKDRYPQVNDLVVFDDGSGSGPAMYVGGYIATAGDVQVNDIAKWDGSSWSALGSGMSGPGFTFVYPMSVFDDGFGPALYAGGHFTAAGGVSANNIAKWNGTSWSPLSSGVIDGEGFTYVGALTVFDDGSGPELYVGGDFATAGGVTVNGIAKWDGLSWSPMGSGLTGYPKFSPGIVAMTVFDDGSGVGPALYIGGFFNSADGVAINNIAKWQGCASQPSTPCAFADLNCDGVVDGLDLLDLIAAWGKCRNCDNCPADLNGNCTVNGFDLVVLLSNWG